MRDKILVLVVDDHKETRTPLVAALLRYGFEVDEAASGRDAFAKLGRKDFSVVITDISMPNGNGIELLNKAKKLRPHIQVFLMSDYPDLYAEYEGFALADAIFRKPLNLVEVVQTVQRACEIISSLVA